MASSRIVWLNGSFVPEDEARISPFDHGFIVGDGCFETLISYYRTPFAFSRHYDQLAHSAAQLGVKGIPRKEELFQATRELILQNRIIDPIRIRLMVTGGVSGLGGDRDANSCTTLVCTAQAPNLGEFCTVQVVPYLRNEKSALAGITSISYAENLVALAKARELGADEAIFANTQGQLCEGAGSNIFWVEDEVVYTPPVSAGARAGVTRALTIELCGQMGIACHEIDAPIDLLNHAKEVFLTSTTREIQPVVAINERRMVAGATTLLLKKAYKDMIEDHLDP